MLNVVETRLNDLAVDAQVGGDGCCVLLTWLPDRGNFTAERRIT